MKKLLIILSLIALLATAGWLWQKNQFLNKNATTPTNIVESIKQKGISLTAEEEALALKLAEGGSNEDQIVSAITKRRSVAPEQAKPLLIDKYVALCKQSRQEVLSDAFAKGVTDLNEIKKLAALYDIVCLGKTDIEIPGSQPQAIESQPNFTFTQPTPISAESFSDKWERERQEKCQEDINEYNTCMNEYNAEMAEYSACLTECNTPNSITGKMPQFCHCVKPYSSCSKPWCM